MKALTVKQPWAWAIIGGGKVVENRTRRTHHRGQVAVHAGLATDPFGVRWMATHVPDLVRPSVYDRGYLLGVVDLVDCHWSRPGCCDTPWAEQAPGVAHLVLEQPRALLYPIAALGRLGLWDLTDDDEAAVLEQLGAAA